MAITQFRNRAGTFSDIELNVDNYQIKRLQETLELYPKLYKKIVSGSVNKIGVSARAHIARRVAKTLNVKIGELKERNVTLKKANYSSLTARIQIKGGRISLKYFAPKKAGKGISYKIDKGRRKRIDGAFFAKMQSGHEGVFARSKDRRMKPNVRTGKTLNKHNAAITELRGPSVPEKFSNIAEFAKTVHEQKISRDLQKELERRLDFELSKMGK